MKNQELVLALQDVERRLKALRDPKDESFSPSGAGGFRCTREERELQAAMVRPYIDTWVLPKVERIRQVLQGTRHARTLKELR